jgi:hypothetical protein
MARYIENTNFDNYKFYMTDVNSSTVGKVGLSPSVEMSDDAGSFSSPSVGSVSELQSGWYKLSRINSSEMISGSIAFVAMASGANEWRDIISPDPLDITSIKSDTGQVLIDISSVDVRVSSVGIDVSSIGVEVSSVTVEVSSISVGLVSVKSDTGEVIANGANITNSAAQLVWTIPISFFESNVTTADRSPYWAVAATINRFNFSGADLVHYRIDDTNILFTIMTSGDANADLIVAGDTQ